MLKINTYLCFEKFFLVAVAGLFIFAPVHASDLEQLADLDKCLACHLEIEMMPANWNKEDIHIQESLSCAGCHGGNPEAEDMETAMDPDIGFIGEPAFEEIPEFCGRCHSDISIMREYQPRISTDQVKQYYTSIHGKKLKQGDEKVANCISCHTAHQILPVKDARSKVYPLNVPQTCNNCHGDRTYMQEYDIPFDQYEKYAESVHGTALLEESDLGSPACNDCHGNHGATPPGIESVSHVCGNCHVNNMEYFEQSPMAEPYEKLDYHACEQCHGYHAVSQTSDDMVGVSEESVCIKCHTSESAGYRVAGIIHNVIDSLAQKYARANDKLKEVQRKGMDDVEIMFVLQKAKQTLIHSRTLVHTFNPVLIKEKSEEGFERLEESIDMANEEIRDFNIRRVGFGFATLFISVLAVALYMRIRDIEKNQKKE